MADPVQTWAGYRKETIKELRKLGEDILYYAKKGKIASSAGKETAVLAGIGAAACFFAAPFTFGGSLAPAAALTGVAVAGGVTSVGASIINHFIEKGCMKSVQEAIDKDRVSFINLKRAIDKAKEITIEEGVEGTVKVDKAVPGAIKITTSITRRLGVAEREAASLLKLGNTARFADHALEVVELPLDIIFFVTDVINKVRGEISDAAKTVMVLADELQKELNDILASA